MAFASEDRQKVWSAQTAVELRERSLMYQLLDRTWEPPWVAGAEKVTIPKPSFNAATARARGGNWKTAEEPGQSVAVLERVGGYSASDEVLWEDALELPWDAVGRTRDRQSYTLAHDIDTAMYTTARAAAGSTLTGGVDGSTYIDRDAPYEAKIAAGSTHPLVAVIKLFSIVAYRANAIIGASSPTGGAGIPFMIMQPELGASLSDYLEDKGLSFDPLTAEILRANPAVRQGVGVIGVYRGVRLFTWNHLSVPTGTDNWSCYAGLPEAYAVGIRPPLAQYFAPGENQVSTKPAHLMRQAGDWAGVEVNNGWHRKISIKAD